MHADLMFLPCLSRRVAVCELCKEKMKEQFNICVMVRYLIIIKIKNIKRAGTVYKTKMTMCGVGRMEVAVLSRSFKYKGFHLRRAAGSVREVPTLLDSKLLSYPD